MERKGETLSDLKPILVLQLTTARDAESRENVPATRTYTDNTEDPTNQSIFTIKSMV